MKGIILAGGSGSRLFPATSHISKHLLPIYDKPMIYYPLTTLMLAGLKDILIISTPKEISLYSHLLKDGSQWGLHIEYASQPKPEGIAQAFMIGETFIGNDSVSLILGDNIVYGDGLSRLLQKATQQTSGASIFGYYVKDPERYGVLSFDENEKLINIIEKPVKAPSHYAVIGLYFYDNHVIDIAKELQPSGRGELEITDINCHYLRNNQLSVTKLSRGYAWLDTGTPYSLLEASNFIHVLEERQGLKIGSPEEVAWRMGYINDDQLQALADPLVKSGYGKYLLDILMSA
jgi:glucose-1-phosphate thymidylyltransferase